MLRITKLALALIGLMFSQAHAQGAFNKTLMLQGVNFHVTCPNEGSQNTLRITPSGALHAPKIIEQQIDGSVVGAEVADLDANGLPEVYVFVQSAGSGSYGIVVGHAVNRGSAITPIVMPELTDDARASAGYMGRDRFSIAGNRVVRQFPVYRDGDPNAAPSGGTRQLHYRLVPREASWALQLVPGETKDSR